MAREPLSARAREFIAAHIHSVRQLELLLLLHAQRDDRWTAGTVAGALKVAPLWAQRELEAMEVIGLVASDGAADPAYSYAPGEDDAVVVEVAEAYRRRKPTVIQAVLSSMGSDVQAFSDAFRLRGPEDG